MQSWGEIASVRQPATIVLEASNALDLKARLSNTNCDFVKIKFQQHSPHHNYVMCVMLPRIKKWRTKNISVTVAFGSFYQLGTREARARLVLRLLYIPAMYVCVCVCVCVCLITWDLYVYSKQGMSVAVPI